MERFRYKPTKARQVQERIKRLEKIEDIETFERSKSMHFSFPAASNSPSVLLECNDVSFSYDGSRKIIGNFDFTLEKGDRIAVIGVNGMGKTTLLKLIHGTLKPSDGEIKISDKTKCAYFSQDAFSRLDESNSVFEEIKRNCAFDDATVQSMLGAFLFSGEDANKKIGVLSGGEKTRVAICKMLLSPSNLLLLDEITNHLDIASKNVLKQALQSFQGSMAFVSHDIDFIRDVANKVIYLDRSGHHVYLGDFSYFVYKVKNDVSLSQIAFARMDDDACISTADGSSIRLRGDMLQSMSNAGARSGKGDGDEKPASQKFDYEESRRRRNERKSLMRQIEAFEKKESELNSLIAEKERMLSSPDVYSDASKAGECAKDIARLKSELEEVENRYFELIDGK